MRARSLLRLALLGLAALAVAAPRPIVAGEPPDEKGEEKPKEKSKEAAKGHFKVRAGDDGAHLVGIRVEEEARVGDCFEVRRADRLVGYAQVAELVKARPKIAYLLGSGRPGDDLVPLIAPVPHAQLLTDEPNAQVAKELKALLGDRLLVQSLAEDEKITLHKHCTARIILQHAGVLFMGADPIAQPFAREGGTVILDTMAYSHVKGETSDESKFKQPATLRILREEGFAAGFPPESRVPWYGTKGKSFVARYFGGVPKPDSGAKLLAADDSGKNSAMLDIDLGGRMAVLDLLTPNGRAGRDPGAKNKLVFVARVLGSGPRYARYMPSKPEYDDIMKWLDDLADKNKERMAKAFEGGDRTADYIYSYTLGPRDKTVPLIILAGVLRGTNWLGACALQRLAEVLIDNPENDPKINWLLGRVRVRIIPILNPQGYRKNVDPNENGVELDRNFGYQWDEFADKKARGRKPFCEAGPAVIQGCIEREKAVAFLEIGVDDYDAGYRVVRARDGTDAQQALLQAVVAIVNARLRYRFVVGDKMLQLRLTRDAERPSASNWAGSKGVLAASLRICGDGEDSITNQDVAIETCLHFLYATALSREKPEPEPAPREKAPPKKATRPQAKDSKAGAK